MPFDAVLGDNCWLQDGVERSILDAVPCDLADLAG